MVTNSKQITIQIQLENANQRVDKFLSTLPEISSRTRAQELIENKKVQIQNNSKFKNKTILTKSSYVLLELDTLFIEIPLKQDSSVLTPYNLKLDICYEDEDLIVVNKPAPLVVHPSHGHSEKTLVHALIHHTKNLSMGFGENRPGIVHRLDKETSGLIVIAKNDFAHHNLAQQFKNRTIHRKYWAFCYGHFLKNKMTIETFLSRHPTQRKKFASSTTGKKAITHIHVLKKSLKNVSLVECKLETGRTHQIRVHLSENQHAILGDKIYTSGSAGLSKNDLQKIQEMSQIALHAKELGFLHPKTQNELFFDSELPNELQKLQEYFGLNI